MNIKQLAIRIAQIGKEIQKNIITKIEGRNSPAPIFSENSKQYLLDNSNINYFAATYVQSLVCELFTRRVHEGTLFFRDHFLEQLVVNSLFQDSQIIDELTENGLLFERNEVKELISLLKNDYLTKIIETFEKNNQEIDISTYFYEEFLIAYHSEQKKKRGIYHTPHSIVSFIVRSVDYLLKTEVDIPNGLADLSQIQILDPALGTGTFLEFVIRHIRASFDEANRYLPTDERSKKWIAYVSEYLLSHMLGFEIAMAPTVIANLKLNYLLKKTGYECASHSSNLFLTNTLNIEIDGNETRGNGTIPPESGLINKLNLSRPLWVIIGNPPYARASRNKSPYIERLLDTYKTAVRTEKNIQPLSDDYIKFIRWAQELIAQTGRGIIGIVTNHTYLTGIIHKGMRQELMRVFDAIYILDLHGSKIIHEDIPFELQDENVFDIKQGICIAFFVKNPHRTHKTVYHLDLFGTRAEKFEWLQKNDMSTISWVNISNIAPGAPFANPSQIPPEKYNEFHSLSELFEFYNVGGKPGDDKLLVALTPEEVENKLRSFIQNKSTGKVTEAKQKLLGHINDFSFNRARIEKYNFRPFDTRWIYYDPHIWTRPVPKLKEQCNDNLLLLCSRIVKDANFAHAFISQLFTDVIFLSNTSSVNCYVFPLWKIDNGKKGWNLSPLYLQYLRSMGINIENLKSTAPMAYLYAILFSTQYRTRYFEFLKRDFPRIPFITDQTLFDKLVQLGETLIQIHLPSDHFEPSSTIQSNISNDDTLKRGFPLYRDEYIFIAPEKWFYQIEKELWDFRIGKFQVCHKWLKDREGRKLTTEEILHYHNILLVLKKTIKVMKMIDSLLAEI